MTRKLRIGLCFAILSIGAVLFGHGLWIKAKAVVAQVLLERAFAETVRTGRPVKAWSWADTHPIARVRSNRLGNQAIVLAGASGEAMAFGPAHVSGTPQPGEPGTSVIAAHRDTHFRFLGKLAAGDILTVTRSDGLHLAFKVTGTRIVSWDRPEIDVNASGHNIALSTCWPIGAMTPGPLRYVVDAELLTGRQVHASKTGQGS